jgi:hypothetical protein
MDLRFQHPTVVGELVLMQDFHLRVFSVSISCKVNTEHYSTQQNKIPLIQSLQDLVDS